MKVERREMRDERKKHVTELSLYRTEDVVLHHGQPKACNLCGEVHGLTLSEIEQHLLIAICVMRSFT